MYRLFSMRLGEGRNRKLCSVPMFPKTGRYQVPRTARVKLNSKHVSSRLDMTTMLKKTWHDPVWSKVIAGAILALGATVATYFLDWWPAIGVFVSGSIAFALASTLTPNWLLLLLALLALPALVIIGALAWQGVSPSEPRSPSWHDYTADIFFGLRWRWNYGTGGRIDDAHTFCPHCDFQVYARDVSSFRVIDHIAFHCDSCGRNLGEFEESFDSLESKVKRFVQQKLRNGTWAERPGA